MLGSCTNVVHQYIECERALVQHTPSPLARAETFDDCSACCQVAALFVYSGLLLCPKAQLYCFGFQDYRIRGPGLLVDIIAGTFCSIHPYTDEIARSEQNMQKKKFMVLLMVNTLIEQCENTISCRGCLHCLKAVLGKSF